MVGAKSLTERLRVHAAPAPGFEKAIHADALRAAQRIEALERVTKAAMHALRSYEFGNGSTELAKSIADECQATLAIELLRDGEAIEWLQVVPAPAASK